MGPPPGRPARRRISRPLLITGVAALVLGAGGGVAAAVTSSPSGAAAQVASPSSLTPGAPSLAPVPGGGRAVRRFYGIGPRAFGLGGMRGRLGPFGALHGEFVVPKASGGYQTIDTQRGQVTAVSTSSITLKSADGFTKSYAVTSSTIVTAARAGIASVHVGDQAVVAATVSGGTATAAGIVDLTNLRQHLFGREPAPAPRSS